MANPLARLLRRDSLRDHVRRAVDSGVGLYHTTWRLSRGESPPEAFAGELIEWCREMLSRIQRPYGMDYVTLALAVLGPDNHIISSVSLGVLRPIDFYAQGAAETQIADTLQQWTRAGVPEAARLSAVLFSWGDLTRELLPAG
ncbi:MAG: hypothetical protein WBD55_07115 [Dehalococcoidia bacterium]